MIGPTERYGKLRIEGTLEYGDRYGHAGGLDSQIVPSEMELLPWSPPAQPDLSISTLKYRLIKHFGGVLVAEPVGVPDDIRKEQATRALATIQEDEEEFRAILDQLGLEDESTYSVERQVQVFEEKARLNAVRLEPIDGGYSFRLLVMEAGEPFEIEGTIGNDAAIEVLNKRRALLPR